MIVKKIIKKLNSLKRNTDGHHISQKEKPMLIIKAEAKSKPIGSLFWFQVVPIWNYLIPLQISSMYKVPDYQPAHPWFNSQNMPQVSKCFFS